MLVASIVLVPLIVGTLFLFYPLMLVRWWVAIGFLSTGSWRYRLATSRNWLLFVRVLGAVYVGFAVIVVGLVVAANYGVDFSWSGFKL